MRLSFSPIVLLAIGLATSPLDAQEMSSSAIRANILRQIEDFNRGASQRKPERTRRIMVSGEASDCASADCDDRIGESDDAPLPATAEPVRPLTVTIQFGYDSAAIPSSAQHTLVSVAAALGDPAAHGHVFQVKGFTDSRGSVAYNLKLSERRAASVVAALRRLGVPRDRMEAVGRGKAGYLAGIDTADARNRRVEVLIVG
jgi:outer membrane protein OmpA-like peptidoglycan-associated protein